MAKYERLIFVCTDNASESPMAEAIYHSLVTESEIDILSRGLVVLFPEPPNPKAVIVCNNHELSIEHHTSQPLIQEDITENTLLLTMDEKQKKSIFDQFDADFVYTIKEYTEELGDVLDPYGKSLIEYEECFVELARLIKKTVLKLNKEE